jgi:hypothetical protein
MKDAVVHIGASDHKAAAKIMRQGHSKIHAAPLS